MTIAEYFEELKTKEIICWGYGKHFRYISYPFLCKSGLIDNLIGFVDVPGMTDTGIGDRTYAGNGDRTYTGINGRTYAKIGRDELADLCGSDKMLLIAVTGYEEILSQLRSDAGTASIEAVPSIFLESLYEDMLLLAAEKPPADFRKHDSQVIPKIIHGIWFSGEPLPELYERCLASWKKYAPDYEIKIWDLESYRADNCLFFEQAIAHKNWSFASDYARADILYRYGGIYMDLDVEMLRPIDDLLYNDAYMSFESLDRIECGSGMGAKPGHPIMREFCASYESRPYLRADGTWDTSTCPVRYTGVIEKHGLKKNGGFQFVEDITIYPFEMLTGKSFDTGIIYSTGSSYTLHHHNGSWIPDKAHRAVNERYKKIRRFLDEKGIEV